MEHDARRQPIHTFEAYSDVVITPYDWQEGISNRAQYIDAKLGQGTPIVGVSAADGILLLSYRRQSRKLFEVYDRLGYGGMGMQSDVEAIRLAAVDFASREGYQRSEQDVTIQRVVSAVSQPIKQAFADFSRAPFVARCLFVELNETPDGDLYYSLDYTGDFGVTRGYGLVAGDDAVESALRTALEEFDRSQAAEAMLGPLDEIWRKAVTPDDGSLDEVLEGLRMEALLIERTDLREDRFRLLTPGD